MCVFATHVHFIFLFFSPHTLKLMLMICNPLKYSTVVFAQTVYFGRCNFLKHACCHYKSDSPKLSFSDRKYLFLRLFSSLSPVLFLFSFLNSKKARELFFFFVFLGPHPQHMEVTRLWVKSELQLPACTPAHGTHGILNLLNKARG